MASFGPLTQGEGLNFAHSPIIVQVVAGTFPATAYLCKVKLRVACTFLLYDENGDYTAVTSEHPFSAEAASGQTIPFDISSAIRSALAPFIPDANEILQSGASFTYPFVRYHLYAKDEYMMKNLHYDTPEAIFGGWVNEQPAVNGIGVAGGLSAFERYKTAHFPSEYPINFSDLTRKPANGEVYAVGDIITHAYFDTQLKRVVATNATIIQGMSTYFDGMRRVFGETNADRRLFAFVNAFGVVETVSALSKESLEWESESEETNLSQTPSFHPSPVRTMIQMEGMESYGCSSGPQTREWIAWWATEFLSAKKFWMMIEGLWIPCTIKPTDEKVTIYDKKTQNLQSVDFNVTPALNGSSITSFVL